MEAIECAKVVEDFRNGDETAELQMLNDLQLALVGGGIGDVVFG